MSANGTAPTVATVQFMQMAQLRTEAAIEPDAVATGPVTKETQIIAIYGKGHWQELHAGQSELHDGAARQKGVADWM